MREARTSSEDVVQMLGSCVWVQVPGVEEKGDEVVGGEKREMEQTGPLVALALQRDGPAWQGSPQCQPVWPIRR